MHHRLSPRRWPGALALAALPLSLGLAAGCQAALSLGQKAGINGTASPTARAIDDRADGLAAEADGDGATAGPDNQPIRGVDDAIATHIPRTGIDWCAGHTVKLHGHDLTNGWDDEEVTQRFITQVAWQGCSLSLTEEQRAATVKAYQRLQSWSRMPRARLRAYLAAMVATPEVDVFERACNQHPANDRTGLALAKLMGCGDWRTLPLPDDDSSQLASLAAVYQCFEADLSERDTDLGRYAACGAEARALDPDTIHRELARIDADAIIRTRIDIDLRQIGYWVARFDSYLKPKVADDPDLKAFFYTIPDRALARGRRMMREGKGDLALVRALERRVLNKRRPRVAGCFGPLYTRVMAHLTASHPKTLAEVRRSLAGPLESQLGVALAVCAAHDGHGAMATGLERLLDGLHSFRGPRSVVYWAMVDALDRIPGQKPIMRSDLDNFPVPSFPGLTVNHSVNDEDGDVEIIRAVTRSHGAVRVTFKSYSEKHEEYDHCHQTNRIDHIENGHVEYQQACKEHTVHQRITPPPALVPAEMAGGLAAGRPAEMLCAPAGPDQRGCVPFAVWKDKKEKRLAGVLGTAL